MNPESQRERIIAAFVQAGPHDLTHGALYELLNVGLSDRQIKGRITLANITSHTGRLKRARIIADTGRKWLNKKTGHQQKGMVLMLFAPKDAAERAEVERLQHELNTKLHKLSVARRKKIITDILRDLLQ
jgi:hypothetical protein